MKHLKKILTMFITIAILCSASVGVHGEGVVFKEDVDGDDDYVNDHYYTHLNEWLINTPYWAVDVFAPGYSTLYLVNHPDGNDKTIDFEITPYKGFKSTVKVADIPEEYRNVYNEFVNGRKTDPEAKIEVVNMVRKNGKLTFDYSAYIQLDVWYDLDEYATDYSVLLYAVTSDKQTGEIIRYDYVDCLVFFNAVKTHCTSVPENIDDDYKYDPTAKYQTKIDFPLNFDHEKHEYGFCLIAYTPYEPLSVIYDGELYTYNYTKVDPPTTINILGDVDGNGIVNTSDLSLFERCLSGGSDKLNINADVNDDGEITTVDYNTLRRQLAYGSHQ